MSAAAPASAFVLYDPIGPDDPFGRQMLLNLDARGCPLRGITGAPDLGGAVQVDPGLAPS